MSFKSSLKLGSAIFSQSRRRAAGGRAVRKTAREFARDVQNKMENSPHTGKTITVARGGNFRVRHQQSRRGQRPAPLTRFLLNSVRMRTISPTKAETRVNADYGEILQNSLGRKIITGKDIDEANESLIKNTEAELRKLI